MGLDKFYTKKEAVKKCIEWLSTYYNTNEIFFIEPSAGNGAFLPFLKQYEAYDIKPENEKILSADFFSIKTTKADFAIGNPPFGKRSKLAIDFINHSAKICDAIAFILPVSFMKWGVQKQINNNFKLVDYFYLDPNSFTDNGKDFAVRCVFQLWVKINGKYDNNFLDKRLKKQPPIKHPDFEIWQYNATAQAASTVEEDWTIATYRQGYHDYNVFFTRENYDFIKSKMFGEKKQQFFFIKPKSKEIYERIIKMDFNALAERNTSTPGFGKTDFVSYYTELYNM